MIRRLIQCWLDWRDLRRWRREIREQVEVMFQYYVTGEKGQALNVWRMGLNKVDPYDKGLDLDNSEISVFNKMKRKANDA